MLDLNTLQNFAFLSEMSPDAQRLVAATSKRLTVGSGDEVLYRGQPVAGVYLVDSGRLRVYILSNKGIEKTIYFIEPGQSCLFAMDCTFKRIAYPAWVNGDRNSTDVIAIPASTFRQLHESEDVIKRFVFDTMSARIFDLMTSLEEVSVFDLDYRLASFLVRAADSDGKLRLQHQQIAAHLGTAREVVSRLLKQLERAGLVELQRGLISIPDLQALARQ